MDRVGGGQGHGALYEVGTLEIHARSRTVLVLRWTINCSTCLENLSSHMARIPGTNLSNAT